MGNLKIPTISMFMSSLESPSLCNGNDYDHLAMLLSVREANTWRHMSSTTLIFSKEGTGLSRITCISWWYCDPIRCNISPTWNQMSKKTLMWRLQFKERNEQINTSVTYFKKSPPREKRQEIFKFRFLECLCHWFQTNAHHNTVAVFR